MPVGDDQRQHLELANDIAQKFNHDYGAAFFPTIEPLILGPAARVMSLRDGTKKMSKSDPSDQSRINLNDDADTIALKIRRAKTDPDPLPSEPEGLALRPEARNLVGIYAALAGTDAAAVLRRARRQGLRHLQGRAGGPAGRASWRRSRAKPTGCSPIPRRSTPCCARVRRARAAIADPIVAEAERLVGFLPPG